MYPTADLLLRTHDSSEGKVVPERSPDESTWDYVSDNPGNGDASGATGIRSLSKQSLRGLSLW